MSGRAGGGEARRQELLVDRATQGLGEADRLELDDLLSADGVTDELDYELAAAAIDLPMILADSAETMPASLRRRVEDDAIGWLARARGLSTAAPPPPPADAPARVARPPRLSRPRLPWLAAAAGIALAVAAWWPRAMPTPAEQYERLRARGDVTRVVWDDLAGGSVSGDIVWDNARQVGVMRFRGLSPNDPDRMQYQLWIFDEARAEFTEFNAVDGGVFDIPGGGDRYVPVDAALHVSRPSLFAVTTEPPGGVVKHVDTDEHRVILVAPVKTS